MSRFVVVTLTCLFLCLLLITGCAQKMPQKYIDAMNSWKGTHISKYIQQVGAYDRIIPDGSGGNIYIWTLHFPMPPPRITPPPSGGGTMSGLMHGLNNVAHARQVERAQTPGVVQMFTRADGTIYHWHVSGYF
jgi:hypothetical protein